MSRHPARSRRYANASRRKLCAFRCRPLPPEEQEKRRVWKATLQAKRYPHPPKYADDNGPQPMQPACYIFRVA